MYGERSTSAIKKATTPDILAPKRKHVRKIIVDSWHYGAINLWKEIAVQKSVRESGVSCFKAFTVIHKVLQEGAPRVLKESYNQLGLVLSLERMWKSANDVHYAKIIGDYGVFLRSKITFHYKHPMVLGNLSVDDYKDKIKNQPEVYLEYRMQMVSHLLDLQESCLNVQKGIFKFHGRDLHEAKEAALVPLVVESDAIFNITVHHIREICDRISSTNQIMDLITRFNSQYPQLRLFYDNASRITYVTQIIQVPRLPPDPPVFSATGRLIHLVPQSDQPIAILPLMIDGQTVQAKAVPVQQVEQTPPQQALPVPSRPPPTPTPQVAQTFGTAQPAASTGWVTFGGPVAQTAVARNVAPVAGTASVGQQAPPAALHQAAVSASGTDLQAQIQELERRIAALEAANAEKDKEIEHWKQVAQEALAKNEEEKRRGDELDMQLQILLENQEKERQAKLARKLEQALGSVEAALARLGNAEKDMKDAIPAGSTPDDVFEATERVKAALQAVSDAISKHDEAALAPAVKHLVKAINDQSNHAKSVGAHLTDDPQIKAEIDAALSATALAIQKLLSLIRDDHHDTATVLESTPAVTDANERLRTAVERLVKAESVEPGEDLTDKATQELLKAAQVIEQATKALLEAKRKAKEEAEKRKKAGHEGVEVADAIIDAAMAITQATAALMERARVVQAENVESGRTSKGGKYYKKDIDFAEGLISASKLVASQVSELVKAANGAVTGTIEEEKLVAASKGVSAATAQLVIAARVRSDPNSSAQIGLEKASKSVAQATRGLVAAAKAASDVEGSVEEEVADISKMTLTERKIKEMEQQTQILKLEKELERSRIKLAKMRKAQYKE